MNAEYLGDGGYSKGEGIRVSERLGRVILTTGRAGEPQNVIYLEPEIVVALLRWLREQEVTP